MVLKKATLALFCGLCLFAGSIRCAEVQNAVPKESDQVVNAPANEYDQVGLALHNELRAKHGAPPLALDKTLNGHAEKCAKYYAEKRALDGSCPYGATAGQNMGQSYNSAGIGKAKAVQEAINLWYAGRKHYDPSTPVFSFKNGAFTQLVWKSSKLLGIGVAQTGQETYTVALYSPPGNVRGHFVENVQP